MNKQITKMIIKLVTLVFSVESSYVTKTVRLINTLREESGVKFMYQYMKQSRLHITRYICGKPLGPVTGSRVSLTNCGPTRLLYLKPLLSTLRGKMVILTLLTLSKGIKPEKSEGNQIQPDFSSITKEYSGKLYVIPKFFCNVMARKYSISADNLAIPSDQNLMLNMKKSPTGVSVTSSFRAALLHDMQTLESFKVLMLNAFYKVFMPVHEFAYKHKEFGPTGFPAGKLAIVHDSEGKERVIAMTDYGTQGCLKPIHDWALGILKTIPMDRTFTQDPFNEGKDDGENYWSLDLTSATDRFPLFLQKKVLRFFLGDDIVDAGADVLVRRSYNYKGNNYFYAVGQPMGAYSSGAVFALTHHFVVQWAAFLCGHLSFKEYILLGDDIVIKNNKVAQKYIALMNKGGVEISKNKTHVSKHTYEFAKRGIHRGQEISPLPCKGLMTHIKEPKSVMVLILDGIIKVKYQINTSVLDLVKRMYIRTKCRKQWYTESSLHRLLYTFYVGLSYTKQTISAEDLIKYGADMGVPEDDLPLSEEVFEFTRRLTNYALGSVFDNAKDRLLRNYTFNFVRNWFKWNYADAVSIHPVLKAVRNTLESMYNQLKAYDPEVQEPVDLGDAFIIPGVNEIVHLKRQVRKEVIAIDRLGRTVAHVPKIGDIWYFIDHDLYWIGKAATLTALEKELNRFRIVCYGAFFQEFPEERPRSSVPICHKDDRLRRPNRRKPPKKPGPRTW